MGYQDTTDQTDSLVSRDQKAKKEQTGREEKWVTEQFCQLISLRLVPVTVFRQAALGSTAHRGNRACRALHGALMSLTPGSCHVEMSGIFLVDQTFLSEQKGQLPRD